MMTREQVVPGWDRMDEKSRATFDQFQRDGRTAGDFRRCTAIAQWQVGDLQCLVRRGGLPLCAYVGLPVGHPLAGVGHKEIDVGRAPIAVHGGITCAQHGGVVTLEDPGDIWWYGWDYAHLDDDLPGMPGHSVHTVGSVVRETQEAAVALLALAEHKEAPE